MSNYIEVWKIKKLVQKLRDARGNGTSMISLIAPPGTQVSQLNRLLTEEYGTATNIKSRVNRLSVLDAITSAQQRLKLYNRLPINGLILYCGTILTQEGKEKRVTIDIEPFKPINTSLYMCDNKFHVDVLKELMEDDDSYGFIIIGGDSCLIGIVQGNTKNVLYQFTVDLPKKHGRGGQSALRFARQRIEARQNYIRKVAELANQYYISDNLCNQKGIIIAGFADLKNELNNSSILDQRIKAKILQTLDIAYGGTSGFNQAIQLSTEVLGTVRFVKERKLIMQFFTEIDLDSGKICYTIPDTLKALEMGAVETLLIWEQAPDTCKIDANGNLVEENFVEEILFVEWIANNYTKYGTTLEFVTDSSQEGTQYVKGFTGIGGLLRWKVDFDNFDSS
jgi:peptide chain release factor subunit 1